MVSLLDETAALEHDDEICVANRAQTVCDNERGAAFEEAVDVAFDDRLGLRVESARRLVEEQHRRLAVEGTGDRQALRLTSRQGQAAVTDRGVVSKGEPLNELGQVGDLCRPVDGVGIRRVVAECDVVRDGGGEHVRRLEDEADLPAEIAVPEASGVGAVEEDHAGCRLDQAGKQAKQRRLPRAGVATPLESKNPYPYSPSHAKALLTSHGWKVVLNGVTTCAKPGTAADECGAGIKAGEGLSFQYLYQSGVVSFDAQIQELASSWAQAGIKLQLEAKAFGDVISAAFTP